MARGWVWSYEGYDPEKERLREALCTLGNGYFATRGAAPETASGDVHYPGTYVAGCYNRLTSSVQGRQVENEDLVNLPNWLPLRYRIHPAGTRPGPWLAPDHAYLVEHGQFLDLRGGTLTRRSVYADRHGRRLTVEQERLVHMGDPHLAALHTTFSAEGWSGELEVEAGIDGDVRNTGVARYRELADRHLTGWETGTEAESAVWLRCRTVESDIGIALAARTLASCGPERDGEHRAEPRQEPRAVHQTMMLPLAPGADAVVDKTVALYTSRDPAIGSPLRAAVSAVDAAPAYSRLLTCCHRSAQALRCEVSSREYAGAASTADTAARSGLPIAGSREV